MVVVRDWQAAAGVLMLGPLFGCEVESGGGPAGSAGVSTLTGVVTYRERIALPAEATVEVRLEDVSRADAPAVTVAEQTIATRGRQVPIPFEVEYASSQFEANRRYGLRAAIRAPSGELMFTTMTRHEVLEPGSALSGIELLVQRVGSGGAGGGPPTAGVAGSQPSTGSITGGPWRLVSIARAGAEAESVPPEPVYTIELGADGRYSGQAHCNRFMGTYERPAPDQIAMRAGAATLAACPQPSIADEFLRTVAAATRYVVRGNELELKTDDGGVLTSPATRRKPRRPR